MHQVQFYSQFLNDPTALANGYNLIKQYLMVGPSQRQATLRNLLHPNIPVLTLVGNIYPNQIFPQLSAQQKSQTRQYLTKLLGETLCSQNAKIICSNLLTFIQRIHNIQGYQNWVELYQFLLINIPQNKVPYLLISILKSADDRVSVLSKHFYQYIMLGFETVQKSFAKNQVLQILYYCTRSLAHLVGTDDETLDVYFMPNLGNLLSLAWNTMQFQQNSQLDSIVSLKWSLKILTVLYGNYNLQNYPQTNEKIRQLPSYCLMLCQKYLSIINSCDANTKEEQERQGQISNLDQQLDEEESEIDQTLIITLIVHQMLELLETIHQNSESIGKAAKKLGIEKILVCLLLACVLSEKQKKYYIKFSDRYLVGLQDEGEKTIRNRCIEFIGNMMYNQQGKQKKVCKTFFRDLVQKIVYISNNQQGSESLKMYLQNFAKQQLKMQGRFQAFEQATYFILLSYASDFFNEKQRKQMTNFLGMRILSTLSLASESQQYTLVKICCLLILNSQIQPSKAISESNNVVKYLVDIGLNSIQHIGVVLAVSRGIAKCTVINQLQLNVHVPLQLIKPLINYLTHQQRNSENFSEDATHIILQYFVMLINAQPDNNALLLTQLINPQVQATMLNKYMHDGLLSGMVIQILQNKHIAHPRIVEHVYNILTQGAINQERWVELLGKWADNGKIDPNSILQPKNIANLLLLYQGSKRNIISPLIKRWFIMIQRAEKGNLQIQEEIKNQLVLLLNQNPDPSWLIYMLKTQTLNNPERLLIQNVRYANYDTTFVSDFQNRLPMPLFLGIHHTQKFITILQSSNVSLENGQKHNLYNDFMEKFLRYAQIFKGDHLRVIASIFMLKISQQNKEIQRKVISLIESYGKMDQSEMQWQDENEEGEADEDQIMQRILGQKIVNQSLQKQLVQTFGELAWASDQVSAKVNELKNNTASA